MRQPLACCIGPHGGVVPDWVGGQSANCRIKTKNPQSFNRGFDVGVSPVVFFAEFNQRDGG